MALRSSLVRALCTFFTCMLVSVASAPSQALHESLVEITATASEAQEDAAETQATRANERILVTPAPPTTCAAHTESEARPNPQRERCTPSTPVYLKHCALLL